MASFFISHSTRDNAVAARVRAWFEREGFTSVFLDFDPEHGVPAGRRWEDELYSELRRADVVVFLGTSAAVTSKWCHAELVLARSLGRKIVPILLESNAEHPLLRDTQWIRVTPDGEDGLRPLAAALRELRVDPLDTLEWDTRLPPYPGLVPFDERRAGVFYGRRDEIEAIIKQLTWPHAEGTERLLLVVGSSGSGKSSLIRGGVLPRLRKLDEGGGVVVPIFTPDDAPLEKLARALATALRTAGRAAEWEACRERLERESGALSELTRDLLDAVGAAGDGRSVVLSVDQGEQLATLCAGSERIAFVDLLVEALAGTAPLRVVLALRSEYLTEAIEGTALEGRAAPTVTVGRLLAPRLTDVIERPAQRAGIEFEAGLVERMVEETKSGAASGGDPLPLLAFTLRQLYDARREPKRITHADYDRVGGVVGALKAEADRIYAQLGQRGKQGAVVPTLLQLVHVEAERDPAGRGVSRARFDAAAWEVVQAFVEARLLTTEGEGATVHVAHEALLREWPVLNRAIEASRDDLVARSRLERDAREWQLAGRDSSYLVGGQRLEVALRARDARWLDAPDPLLSDFVAASRRHAARQAWRSRVLVALIAVAVAAALAAGAWYVADRARESSRKEAARAAFVRFPAGGLPAFALDEHEVTYAQYRLCVREGRCRRPEEPVGAPRFDTAPETQPAVAVVAAQATRFCAWIGRRLPTVKELERAQSSPAVKHLIKTEGGREWTSTTADQAVLALMRDPESGKAERIPMEPAFPDLRAGFRCADS